MPKSTVLQIVGAAVAGGIGAAVWAGITIATGYELGYVAWGIGLLVGFAVKVFSDGGDLGGVIAAVFTVLAICGGKVIAVDQSIARDLDELITMSHYQEVSWDARELPSANSEQLPVYLIEHGYYDAASPADVPQDFINEFNSLDRPYLQEFASQSPSFQDWKEDQISEIRQSVPFTTALKESLGIIDIAFFIFGVITAFQVGSRGSHES